MAPAAFPTVIIRSPVIDSWEILQSRGAPVSNVDRSTSCACLPTMPAGTGRQSYGLRSGCGAELLRVVHVSSHRAVAFAGSNDQRIPVQYRDVPATAAYCTRNL